MSTFIVINRIVDATGMSKSDPVEYPTLEAAKAAMSDTTRLLRQAGFYVTDSDTWFVELSKQDEGSFVITDASMRIVQKG